MNRPQYFEHSAMEKLRRNETKSNENIDSTTVNIQSYVHDISRKNIKVIVLVHPDVVAAFTQPSHCHTFFVWIMTCSSKLIINNYDTISINILYALTNNRPTDRERSLIEPTRLYSICFRNCILWCYVFI